ncbi:erythromycin esterase family protein [Amycolatopsis sp. NBC_01286]|uniref:erythromycin esterase family protein n=1 Tax=Amycolatopsis sp. NBC_01286 TaxID=2903560 RepID=UPI002E13BB05|nr:erythromycin esterase family protein [Amycolatopsis sp. NBC_01286]
MSQDIRDFAPASCTLLGYGEPSHQEPAFPLRRNALFAQLAGHGFRSIALETDRVAALAVDGFVRDGAGTLDTAMKEGFSHSFGELDANRRLVAWMREHNEPLPAAERLAFHGFDASTEMMSAPSPRRYLEHARDYLGLDVDVASLAGDDDRWSRTEAVMDAAASPGATPAADALRAIADDLLTTLHSRAPERIAATSRAEWVRARTHLTAGLGLLRYHKQAAIDGAERYSRLSGTRDAIMAQNLLDIRDLEAQRGPTMVFAHNSHLQRGTSTWNSAVANLVWSGAGAIVGSLLGERYVFVAGSVGRSEALRLGEPEPETYEASLQDRVDGWGLVRAVEPGRTRTDAIPETGYFPLTPEVLDGADAVLHISATT